MHKHPDETAPAIAPPPAPVAAAGALASVEPEAAPFGIWESLESYWAWGLIGVLTVGLVFVAVRSLRPKGKGRGLIYNS